MQLNTFMICLDVGFLWLSRLAFLNLLWMVFSAAGLFIFGVFPATMATMAICKKWLHGEEDIKIFREFLAFYKESFVAANKIGLAFTGVSYILYLNFLVINANGANIVFIAAFYAITFFVLITATHIMPIYVYEKSSFVFLVRKAFIVSLLNIHFSLAILISQSAIYYLLFSYPASVLFFLGSALAMIQMWLAVRSFHRLEKKSNQSINQKKRVFNFKRISQRNKFNKYLNGPIAKFMIYFTL
ncbi:YesL family protein [Peribacillus frigoritolerans]